MTQARRRTMTLLVTALVTARRVACLLAVVMLSTSFSRATLATSSASASFSTSVTSASAAAGGTRVAASDDASCALRSGSVTCVGSLAGHRYGANPSAVPLPGGAKATAIEAGDNFACAVLVKGAVACWGGNAHGQLGNGKINGSSASPVLVKLPPGRRAKAVAASGDHAAGHHACALLDDATVVCWGSNLHGELGEGAVNRGSGVPRMVAFAGKAVAIGAGVDSSCAVTQGGAGVCWGESYDGLKPHTRPEDAGAPVALLLPPGRRLATLQPGFDHRCGILDDGTVACWQDTFESLPSISRLRLKVTTLANGGGAFDGDSSITCITLANGAAACKGDGSLGELGNGTLKSPLNYVPIKIPRNLRVGEIAVGRSHLCAALSDDSIVCTGEDNVGQLGVPGAAVTSGAFVGSVTPVLSQL